MPQNKSFSKLRFNNILKDYPNKIKKDELEISSLRKVSRLLENQTNEFKSFNHENELLNYKSFHNEEDSINQEKNNKQEIIDIKTNSKNNILIKGKKGKSLKDSQGNINKELMQIQPEINVQNKVVPSKNILDSDLKSRIKNSINSNNFFHDYSSFLSPKNKRTSISNSREIPSKKIRFKTFGKSNTLATKSTENIYQIELKRALEKEQSLLNITQKRITDFNSPFLDDLLKNHKRHSLKSQKRKNFL